ncbi:hypothetical protein QYE76_039395 [Lolium multiflorum]|uniref:Retrotransposon gag domain-containing protein n=1 Tax=Lolium multiflorum TaxID=4521 RepID=A0AAD8TAZ5_LOLMU|nr:hypothetical protein QYE76_039395 [Lolium multiflorum]
MDAEDWLMDTERKLNTVGCNDLEKVRYATHLLCGPAASWWDNIVAVYPAEKVFTWEEFKRKFRESNVPESIVELNCREFESLEQKNNAILTYVREFSKLSPYAVEEVNTKERRRRAPYATGDIHNSAPHLHNGYSRISGNSLEAQVPSSSVATYENNDCRGKLAAEFKKLNALHQELEENPWDLAAIHAYESYKKKREEERQANNIRFCPSQLQSFGNTSLPKERKTSIRGQQCLAEVNANKVITFDDLSEEQRQGYEVLKNKRKEEFEVLENKLKEEHKAYMKKLEDEDLLFFHAMIKKNP